MIKKTTTVEKNQKISQAEVKKFETDSDKRLTRFFVICFCLCLALGLHFTFMELIAPSIQSFIEYTSVKTTMNIVDPYKKPEPKKPKVSKQNNPKKPGKRTGPGGRRMGRGNPKDISGVGVLQYITSKSRSNAHDAYRIMQRSFADVKKSMDNIASLKSTGNSRFSGRKGKADAGWNEGTGPGGSGGIDNMINNLWDGGGITMDPRANGEMKIPSAGEITMGQSGTRRSAASILQVVRSHMPGLRHTYNKHLKKRPGFSGKIHIRFEISPSGKTVSVSVVSSTTGVPAFDAEIKNKVRRWRFEPINAKGNDNVTIPFTFSE